MSAFTRVPWVGAVARINRCENPRMSVSTTGWSSSVSSGGGTVSVVREGGGTIGYSHRLAVTASASGTDLGALTHFAVTAGLRYTLSATTRANFGTDTRWIIQWRDASNAVIGAPVQVQRPTPVNTFIRDGLADYVAPAGAVLATLQVRRIGAFPAGAVLYVSGVLCEEGATSILDYFDGDTTTLRTRGAWLGTVGLSASSLTTPTAAESLVPALVVAPWTTARTVRSILHEPLDNPAAVSVTHRPAAARAGELQLLFGTAAEAAAAADWLTAWSSGFSFDGHDVPAMSIPRFHLTPDAGLAWGMADELVRSSASNEFVWALTLRWTEVPA